jgi:hypothetical protein
MISCSPFLNELCCSRQRSMSALRKLVFSVALLFCVSSVLAQMSESPLASIRSALRAKDFDKAVELSRAALRDSPNDTQLWTRQGVLNLVPNPDVIQETNIQVNTFASEYGRGSGLQTALTTKSGTDTFHGLASDYFNYQPMYAKYSLRGSSGSYAPFHSNNISATIGGPIIPHHQFFFFGVEPLRSSYSTGGVGLTFADGAFASWAQTNYKNTHITERLNFQFRFELFNLFNHPNFQNIQGDLSAGNFGRVTAQTLPRWWQIGGKLSF